jgi:hypothetical protein
MANILNNVTASQICFPYRSERNSKSNQVGQATLQYYNINGGAIYKDNNSGSSVSPSLAYGVLVNGTQIGFFGNSQAIY